MKKVYYLLSICLLPLFSSCGDDIDPIERPQFEIDWDESLEMKSEETPMVHPGIFSESDYERGRSNIASGHATFQMLWANLNSQCNLNFTPNPTKKIIRDGNKPEEPEPTNYPNANNNIRAAYYLALRWHLTEDPVEGKPYADKAIEILNAWAATCEAVTGDPNYALAAGLTGSQFAITGEMMRDYEGWAEEDFKKYQEWAVKVFYQANSGYLSGHMGSEPLHFWANWDLCNLTSMMAVGILADRRDIYNEAIKYLLNGVGNGRLTNAVNHVFDGEYANFAQTQETGRDQGHATLTIALMSEICQMGWTQGDDIWGYNDNQLLKAFELTSCYNVAMQDIPFEPYIYHKNFTETELLETVGADARGKNRPMWSMPYYHYSVVKGVDADKTKFTYMGYKTQVSLKQDDADIINYTDLMFGLPVND